MQLSDQSVLIYEKARSPLTSLNISGNPIGISGVIKLISGLTSPGKTLNFTNLNISKTNTFFHASDQYAGQLANLLRVSPQLHQLKTLDLSANLLGDNSAINLLDCLYNLANLSELRLSDDHLGDKFIRNLSLTGFS